MRAKRRGRRMLGMDAASTRGALQVPQRSFIEWGTVGHVDELTGLPEPTAAFARVEAGQLLVECTIEPYGDQIVARLALEDADIDSGSYVPLTFGSRVALAFVAGTTNNAIIFGRFNDVQSPFPSTVATMPTGAAGGIAPGAFVPAPAWGFLKTAAGQLLAIETGAGGDVVIHSGASLEIRTVLPTSAIHLNGRVALGGQPVAPPVGAVVGPAGTQVPGTPMVAQPFVAAPIASTPAPPLTIVPMVGMPDSIVRAKDGVQSHIGVDPHFWAFITALYAHPLIGPVLGAAGIACPIALHSEHGGRNGPASWHTASDPGA